MRDRGCYMIREPASNGPEQHMRLATTLRVTPQPVPHRTRTSAAARSRASPPPARGRGSRSCCTTHTASRARSCPFRAGWTRADPCRAPRATRTRLSGSPWSVRHSLWGPRHGRAACRRAAAARRRRGARCRTPAAARGRGRRRTRSPRRAGSSARGRSRRRPCRCPSRRWRCRSWRGGRTRGGRSPGSRTRARRGWRRRALGRTRRTGSRRPSSDQVVSALSCHLCQPATVFERGHWSTTSFTRRTRTASISYLTARRRMGVTAMAMSSNSLLFELNIVAVACRTR